MCMQDLAINKFSSAVEFSVPVAATLTPFIDADLRRSAIIISPPATNPLFITTNPSGAAGTGIRINTGTSPFPIKLGDYGDMVRKRLFASIPAGAETIFVWTTTILVPDIAIMREWERIIGMSK